MLNQSLDQIMPCSRNNPSIQSYCQIFMEIPEANVFLIYKKKINSKPI